MRQWISYQEVLDRFETAKEILQNTKYSIHYYQREYMWQRKHIEELIDDLTSEFLEYYKTDDPRQAVADYGAYFMGSIVLAGRENAIIDGQQRFSSLTLLLMYLNNRLKSIGQSYDMSRVSSSTTGDLPYPAIPRSAMLTELKRRI